MGLAAGQVFAGYTVLRLLGSGGMGEVYLARHPRLPRQDALKVLPASIGDDHEFRARLEREADMAATLWHPHIVGVHDRGEFDGRLWISMDYVDGTDAARVLRERHPDGMPADDVVEIVTAIADALDHAHERQLLHRDVKPANILMTEAVRRRILLADFGIARRADDVDGLTSANLTVGSVAYTAPEQLMAEPVDGRADQYGLASTAFHLLTGAPPFSHTNAAVVISRHLSAPPPAIGDTHPHLAALSPVLTTALAKDPGHRYDTCLEFAAALQDAAADVTPAVVRPSPRHQPTAPQPTVHLPTVAAERPAAPPVFVSSWSDQPEEQAPQHNSRPARRSEAEFWVDVGVDPIKVALEHRTVYSLRCYVDERPYFLGSRGRVTAFESKTELLDFLGSDHDHDLVELATFGEIAAAARRRSRRITVASRNAYSFVGLRSGFARGGQGVDVDQFELAVELALDLAEYTGDSVITRMFEPGAPLDLLVRHVAFEEGQPLDESARRQAAVAWQGLEDRLDEHF